MPKVLKENPLRSLVLLNLYETTAMTYDDLKEDAPSKAQFFAQKYRSATGISPQDRSTVVEELRELAGVSPG